MRPRDAAALIPIVALALPAAADPPAPFDASGFASNAEPFLRQNCARCHGEAKAKGDFRIDRDLGHDFRDAAVADHWRTVVEMLDEGRMPPKKEPRPPPAEVTRVIGWINDQLAAGEAERRKGVSNLRRLSRDEYRNTVQELTGVSPDISAIPLDPAAGGFSNSSRTLVFSPLHVELFAEVARATLDRALVDGKRPGTVRWRFQPEEGEGDDHRIELGGQHPIVQGGKNRKQGGFTVMHHDEWDRVPVARDFHVPHAGTYVIRIHAGGRIPGRAEVVAAAEKELAARRKKSDAEEPGHAHDHAEEYAHDLRHFEEARMYDYGPPRLRVVQSLGAQVKVLGEFDVDAPANRPATYEVRTWLDGQELGISLQYAYSVPSVLENFWMQTHDGFARPEVWLDWFELEGPVYDHWPPTSHSRILFPDRGGKDERTYVREVLRRFMVRAFRGPVTDAEVEAKLALYDRFRKTKGSLVEAIKVPLVAVLVSPRFLYLAGPPAATQTAALGDHELASRLSYFLWATMPDGELFDLADRGQLHDPATLRQQAARMLRDGRAKALVDDFAAEWLGLGEVGATPPAVDLYPEYDRHLELSMVGESKAYFDEIVRGNHSVLDFLRSDYVTINERLARFYGVKGVKGDAFRRVHVPADTHRGGLLTQASMLTTTSNGTRTSPVKRGVWVLRTLLGVDPGSPVANAGEIKPKVPGVDKATVRQRLEAHRANPECARCHQKIDPLGMALENFDAEGSWRDREGFGFKGRVEEGDPLIDATAKTEDGTSLSGAAGLQSYLVAHADQFRRCLASKTMAYALGRELGQPDRAPVEAAAAEMKRQGDTFAALVAAIVANPVFRAR